MTMKKIALCLLIASMSVVTLQAQDLDARQHKMHGGHDFGMMAEKLNLSEDQKAKMKTINEDFRTQMTELKKNDNITVKEWKSKMQTLRKDQHTKMQGLLTDEQKAQLEKMKTERKAMRDVNAKARMEKMKIKLGLTDDQAAKMSRNHSEMAEKLKAIHDNNSLDEASKKEQMKELMKQQKEKMKSILTEEQIKKLHDSKREGHPKKEPI
jgi:Spy/CpxP family protein refolding chaperone